MEFMSWFSQISRKSSYLMRVIGTHGNLIKDCIHQEELRLPCLCRDGILRKEYCNKCSSCLSVHVGPEDKFVVSFLLPPLQGSQGLNSSPSLHDKCFYPNEPFHWPQSHSSKLPIKINLSKIKANVDLKSIWEWQCTRRIISNWLFERRM